jgi:hypothetical protein
MLVVTGVTYLLGTRLGTESEVRFLGDLASGNLITEPVAASDWLRIAELTSTYGYLPLGPSMRQWWRPANGSGYRNWQRLTVAISPWSGRHMSTLSNCCLDRPRISISPCVPGAPIPPVVTARTAPVTLVRGRAEGRLLLGRVRNIYLR